MKKEIVIIEVLIDHSCEMAIVSVDDECIMEGNFWDFHPGCHGITEYGEFHTHAGLVQVLKNYYTAKGKHVEIKRGTYEYE